jgi:hypothetical protein
MTMCFLGFGCSPKFLTLQCLLYYSVYIDVRIILGVCDIFSYTCIIILDRSAILNKP